MNQPKNAGTVQFIFTHVVAATGNKNIINGSENEIINQCSTDFCLNELLTEFQIPAHNNGMGIMPYIPTIVPINPKKKSGRNLVISPDLRCV